METKDAGFCRRLGAALSDAVIVVCLAGAGQYLFLSREQYSLYALLFWASLCIVDSVSLVFALTLILYVFNLVFLQTAGMSITPIVGKINELIAAFGLFILFNYLYHALMESSANQATVGKMLLKIKVTDLEGQRISFWRATSRHFSKILSTAILLIGFLMPGWTKRKQTLHDKIAGCLVERAGCAPTDSI